MSIKIALVTGGNAGLGLEIVRALFRSSQSYHIYISGRDITKAEAASEDVLTQEKPGGDSKIEPIQLDIEDDDSLARAFDAIERQSGHLDILVNNAGASFDQELHEGKLTVREAWNKSWAVNTTGSHIATTVFIPLLLKSSSPRLLFITSGTSTLSGQENEKLALDMAPEEGWPKTELSWSSYRSAKTGMNMMMREWTRILKHDRVKTFAVSPGLLATGLGGNTAALRRMGAIEPHIGAQLVLSVIEGGRDEAVGKILNRSGIQDW